MLRKYQKIVKLTMQRQIYFILQHMTAPLQFKSRILSINHFSSESQLSFFYMECEGVYVIGTYIH